MSKLINYLNDYFKIQDKILLIYRPTEKHYWGDRCLFLDEKFDQLKPYNHRGILQNEVVFEWDSDDKERNREYCDQICNRLKKAGYHIAKWESGNKSTHLHTFIDVGNSSNPSLLKKCFVRYYSEGSPLPDLRLCSNNHPIRAEYGLHEKTGNYKKLISKSGLYPKVMPILPEVWDLYTKEMERIMKRRTTINLTGIVDHPGFKFLLSTNFKDLDDGRERAMFLLIHTLKGQYEGRKDEFVKFLQEWYRYGGGTKLTPEQIRHKVNYHWNKTYKVGIPYLEGLLEELGYKDVENRG